MIFILLVNRPALSCLHHVYDFINDSYHKRQRLWPSVAEEIKHICGLLPMIVSDMRRPWSPIVSAVDACESGMGVVGRVADPDDVKTIGIWSDRWRYKHLPVEQWVARDRALESLNAFSPLSAAAPTDRQEPRAIQILDPSFPEIPNSMIHGPWASFEPNPF